MNQLRYAEVEPLFKRSLALWEKAVGSGPPGCGHVDQWPCVPLQEPGPLEDRLSQHLERVRLLGANQHGADVPLLPAATQRCTRSSMRAAGPTR